ncbi:MAG: FecR domain-containing protein, partial [Nitrosomonas sp.]|nr:FecR domain-containing protein [Nitrosomonas sp.]
MRLLLMKGCLILNGWLFILISLLVLSTSVSAEEWTYTVRDGDNLWNVTERHLSSMKYIKRLQQLNRIQDPYAIPPGTKLRIPIAWTQPNTREVFAQVVAVHGAATVRRVNATEDQVIIQDMRLSQGDEIQSENDAFVTVQFADGSRMRVQDNSYVRLEHMEVFGDFGLVDTLIELKQGRTENDVPIKSDVGTRFRIKTPSAISSVRGTDFRVGILEDGARTSSEVLAGVVQVSGEKRAVRVPAGFGSVTSLGAAPLPPVTLLPAPDLSATPTFYESLPLVITLNPLSDAEAYRAQIAIDREFENLWADFTTASLPFRDGNIPDGDYWLRIRGIDDSGIEGKDSVVAFSLNARPEPPFVTAPLPGAAVDVEKPEFHWAAQSEAAHYVVMISQQEDFSSLVFFDPAVKANSLKLSEPLEPGHYFWRVVSVSATEGAGPYSDVMPFRAPFPAPELEEPEFDESEMTFAWRAGAEGQSFHFQFASDDAFNNLIHDQHTTASQATIPLPDGGSYYLRVKTIEADGFEGPWGAPQLIEIPYDIPYWMLILL